jgi:hypothetical protein
VVLLLKRVHMKKFRYNFQNDSVSLNDFRDALSSLFTRPAKMLWVTKIQVLNVHICKAILPRFVFCRSNTNQPVTPGTGGNAAYCITTLVFHGNECVVTASSCRAAAVPQTLHMPTHTHTEAHTTANAK